MTSPEILTLPASNLLQSTTCFSSLRNSQHHKIQAATKFRANMFLIISWLSRMLFPTWKRLVIVPACFLNGHEETTGPDVWRSTWYAYYASCPAPGTTRMTAKDLMKIIQATVMMSSKTSVISLMLIISCQAKAKKGIASSDSLRFSGTAFQSPTTHWTWKSEPNTKNNIEQQRNTTQLWPRPRIDAREALKVVPYQVAIISPQVGQISPAAT